MIRSESPCRNAMDGSFNVFFDLYCLAAFLFLRFAEVELEAHSESAKLRRRYVNYFRCVRQVAALYLSEVCPIWQW